MTTCVLEPYIDEIVDLLNAEFDRFGGVMPELHLIGWQAYLMTEVIDHVDYEKVRQFLPNLEDDPGALNPVHAIGIGKHYFEHDPSIPEGECLYETEFEGLSRKIGQDKKHFGGALPPGFTVAWSGKLLGLHDCNEITDHEYEQLKAMLPELEGNPVKEVEALTRKYVAGGSGSDKIPYVSEVRESQS